MLWVVRVLRTVENLTFDVSDAMTISAPHLQTRVGRVDVGSHCTAYVALRGYLEDNLTSMGIAEIRAVAAVLMTVPYLQLLGIRVEGCQMDSIAVSHASIVQSASVVVNSHRAIGNLVAAIAIDISHAQVVVPLSCIGGPFWGIGVKRPMILQLFAVPIPCGDDGTGVVAPAKDS